MDMFDMIFYFMMYENKIWNSKHGWSIFVISSRSVPLETYSLIAAQNCVCFQWGDPPFQTGIQHESAILRIVYNFSSCRGFSIAIVSYSYTPHTLCACRSQSEFRIHKIHESVLAVSKSSDNPRWKIHVSDHKEDTTQLNNTSFFGPSFLPVHQCRQSLLSIQPVLQHPSHGALQMASTCSWCTSCI